MRLNKAAQKMSVAARLKIDEIDNLMKPISREYTVMWTDHSGDLQTTGDGNKNFHALCGLLYLRMAMGSNLEPEEIDNLTERIRKG